MHQLLAIIPNYSRTASDVGMLRRSLVALRNVEPDLNVFIWDDKSPIEPAAVIRVAREFNCSLYLSPLKCQAYADIINLSLSWARERGYRRFLTMNSDVEPVTPFTETAYGIWEEGLADVFGGTLLYPTGRIQSAGFTVTVDGVPYEYSKGLPHVSDVASKRAQFVPGVTGAMQFFTDACGDYPTGYRFGYEDIHFCLSQWMSGRSVLYVPSIEAVHSESVTRGRFPGADDLLTVEQWQRERHQFDVPRIEQLASRRSLRCLSQTQAGLTRRPLLEPRTLGARQTPAGPGSLATGQG